MSTQRYLRSVTPQRCPSPGLSATSAMVPSTVNVTEAQAGPESAPLRGKQSAFDKLEQSAMLRGKMFHLFQCPSENGCLENVHKGL